MGAGLWRVVALFLHGQIVYNLSVHFLLLFIYHIGSIFQKFSPILEKF
jgi:hypothetical protein